MENTPNSTLMRVWYKASKKGESLGSVPFQYTEVSGRTEAMRILSAHIKEDQDNPAIESNAMGLEVFRANEWSEWENREGEDIMELLDQQEAANEPKSKNQKLFIRDAEAQGFAIDYLYSGRGMYGKTCPAVRIGRDDDRGTFGTKAKTREDSMGLGYVIYAQV